MKKLFLVFFLLFLVPGCTTNYWRCSNGNPSNWDANTLDFCKEYKHGTGVVLLGLG